MSFFRWFVDLLMFAGEISVKKLSPLFFSDQTTFMQFVFWGGFLFLKK